ncbi:MAG: hypothetical protein A2046_05795 [Bacteroidetes bacterium GWA2_30_7]|nr:MAG: hypothetical protein A2046_05795 [Bacteroidetes bacterium GWA2_30_7]
MNNFFEELKKYFEGNTREKVLEDWAKSAEFDKVGPTVEEFLHNTNQYYQIHSEEPLGVCLTGINEYNPKFTSGFFMSNKNISICKKQHFQL